MSTTAIPDRFTTLPDEHALQATVVALEEHGFSVEVVARKISMSAAASTPVYFAMTARTCPVAVSRWASPGRSGPGRELTVGPARGGCGPCPG